LNASDTTAPIFLTGFARSGTTLCKSLLDQHPKIRLFNELEVIHHLYQLGYGTSERFSFEEIQRVLDRMAEVSNKAFRDHHARHQKSMIPQKTSPGETVSFKDLYESILLNPAQTPCWGEKSLNAVFYAKEIASLYPNALWIFLVRDPRAVICSRAVKRIAKSRNRSTSEISPGQITLCGEWVSYFAVQAFQWRYWMIRRRQCLRRIDPGRFLTIRFEDLVRDPEPVLRSVCERLGLRFDPEMLSANKRARDPILKGEARYAHANIARPLDSSRVFSYRELPAPYRWIIERVNRDFLAEQGYPDSSLRFRSLPRKLELLHLLAKNMKSIFSRVAAYRRSREIPVSPSR
jgi:hypothetical protein